MHIDNAVLLTLQNGLPLLPVLSMWLELDCFDMAEGRMGVCVCVQ